MTPLGHRAEAATVVPNANTVPMAWVGTPAQRSSTLLTLQAALNAAPAGQTVSFDPNDYVFTTRLTVPKEVRLVTTAPSTLFAQFLVTGGGLSTGDDVTLGVNATGAVVTVNQQGAALDDLTINNPNGVLRPTGVQLAATATGVEINRLTMDGGGQPSSFGINMTTGSASITDPAISGVASGIAATATSTAPGVSVTGGSIEATATGISLGTTPQPLVSRVRVSGTDVAQTVGISLYQAPGAVLDRLNVSRYASGITANVAGTGQGPRITSPVVTDISLGGITLGSTQGAIITDARVSGTGVSGSTGINTVNAGKVTITDATISGFGYGIGSQSSIPAGSLPRADFKLTNIDVTGIPNVSTGIYLLGTTDAQITHVEADVTGPGVVVHQSSGTRVSDLQVTGHDGPSPTSGSSTFRGYDSSDLTVDDSSISAGSYGFYLSSTDDVTITDAEVRNVAEYAVFARSADGVAVSGSTFTDNGGAGLFSVHPTGDGPSQNITLSRNTMSGNRLGVNLTTGTHDVTFTNNTVSDQQYVVSAAPAHDVTIAHNTVSQSGSAAGEAAIMVRPLSEDAAVAGSYASSGIEVRDNTFHGGGTWVAAGSPDAAGADAGRRTLSDPVLVVGNTFPADSVAVRTFANAVAEPPLARLAVPAASVAVDARDHGDANDWGSACRPTGYLDGDLVYDGGGAQVEALSTAQVLYPTTCVALSLTERMDMAPSPGETVTWTLTPRNDGPRGAPAGWSITQLLPQGVDLISMEGTGYTISGLTATAGSDLGVHADGPPLTVRVRVTGTWTTDTLMKNVAYVAPASAATDLDGDGFPDTIVERPGPLVVPTLDTDTDESETDNDAQGFWRVLANGGVVPLPPSTDPPSGGRHPDPGIWLLATPPAGEPLTGDTLPGTGAPADLLEWLTLGGGLVGLGCVAVLLGAGHLRRRPGRRVSQR